MSSPQLDHERAMASAERALAARSQGDHDQALVLFRQAFNHERQAALLLADNRSAEPTRSVLLRSAAALAIDCQELREAERLIGLALSGEPPAEIALELRDLLEQVNFRRHLEVHGVTLSPEEFQISLSGNAVGLGIVQQDELISRLNWTRTLLFRTAERKRGRAFKERVPRSVRREFDVFVSAPRAASMAISLRFGTLGQIELPGVGFGGVVVDEFLTCVEVLQESAEELKKRIQDEAYFRNFTEITKQLAPDGEQIRQVGFTAIRHGQERSVSLTIPPERLQVPGDEVEAGAEVLELRGQLKGAEDIKEHRIRLENRGRPSPWVAVPAGMMADIVRPMWDEVVLVTAVTSPKGILLKSIRRIEE